MQNWKNPVSLADIIKAEINMKKSKLVFPSRLKYCINMSKEHHAEVYHAIETIQPVKSFKIRGAFNALANLTKEQMEKGVICASAGNHAQGTAISATKLGIKSYICMPSNAPLSKIMATKNFGGNVILADEPLFDSANALSKKLANEKGYTLIPPFDDVNVIAGQGTIAYELLSKNPDIETFVVPIGGGGLISGIATCAKMINPKIRIIGVQAERFPAMQMSFTQKKIVSYAAGQPTIADGCAVKTPGNITFDIISHLVDEIVTVNEDEICQAIANLSINGKIVAEGAGAMPTAALMFNKFKIHEGEKIVLLVSGGNIDAIKFNNVVNRGLELLGRRLRIQVDLTNKNLDGFIKCLSANSSSAVTLIDEKIIDKNFKPANVAIAIYSLSNENLTNLKQDLTKQNISFSIIE